MNKKLKVILFAIIAIVTVLLVTSCDESPYAGYDKSGYTASVKFDANGGTFTAGTSVIVDTYSLSTLPTVDGQKVAKLIATNDALRGDGNSFVPSKQGYFFAGWYAKRDLNVDENGKVTYSYSDMWDFENDRLTLDPNKEYTSSEPVLTLYAGWVPKFTFQFYSVDNPDVMLKEYDVSPYTEIDIPKWDEKSTKGEIKMYQFPTIDGKTFNGVYLDPEMTSPITGNKIKHYGEIDYETATAENTVMKLYIDTIDGIWYHIFNTTQLKNMSLNGNYLIENDIDLEGNTRNWASFLTSGKFTGKIIGKEQENGEAVKLKNITFYQATMGGSTSSTGLFGQIAEGAEIENIAFENVTMEIDSGAPLTSNVSFGLLAGTISNGAALNNVSVSGTVKIAASCSFQGGYSIGLICGTGTHSIDYSKVTCELTGENTGNVALSIEGDMVELEYAQAE